MTEPPEDCDYDCEKTLRAILHTLEGLFRDHYILFHSTLEVQRDILDAMWVLSQRFLILTRGTLCVQPYPREPTVREEREITSAFYEKKKLLHESSTKLTASLYTLKEKCGAFDRAMNKVDTSLPGEILEGDDTRQPIYYYIELFADLFQFFHQIQNKLNLLGRFLMVEDIGSILEYKHLMEPDSVINNYFEKCLNIGDKS